MALVEFTPKGFYIPKADCYIDPSRKVNRAIITHGHSDHARRGHQHYTATPLTALIMSHRYNISTDACYPFGESFQINEVLFSFHSAGHVPGSAQVRIECDGEVWVITGDYKRAVDNVCVPFELVPCDHFITECTFGLPIYRWKSEYELMEEVLDWWQENQKNRRASLLMGYSLGKAQRLMQLISDPIGPIYTHPTIHSMNGVLDAGGVNLHPAEVIEGPNQIKDLGESLIIAPGSALRSPWIESIGHFSSASASGWNQSGRLITPAANRHFVISDHADWPQLIDTVEATGAQNIYVMHGFTDSFGGYLREQGYNAQTVEHRLNQK